MPNSPGVSPNPALGSPEVRLHPTRLQILCLPRWEPLETHQLSLDWSSSRSFLFQVFVQPIPQRHSCIQKTLLFQPSLVFWQSQASLANLKNCYNFGVCPAHWKVVRVCCGVCSKMIIQSSITAWQRDCCSRLQCSRLVGVTLHCLPSKIHPYDADFCRNSLTACSNCIQLGTACFTGLCWVFYFDRCSAPHVLTCIADVTWRLSVEVTAFEALVLYFCKI